MSNQNEGVSLPVTNPYTGEVDYQITPPTEQELTELCDSLRAAQVKWAAAPLEHRVEVMLRWADELDAAYGKLSAADFTDTGGGLLALMSIALQDTFLTLFKTRDIGTNSFADSGLGGDRTGPGSILRFVRKKALMTQSAPPAPLARPAPPPGPPRLAWWPPPQRSCALSGRIPLSSAHDNPRTY
jgi:hypothetical protein